jgi:NADH-quinone oxidoreductase subunit J
MEGFSLPFPITPNLLVFLALAGIAAAATVGVVFFQDAVRSALCLVLNFFVLAFLYFTLNAEMLGISQIVVYTGAIMVLFLFVIMLLNLGAASALKEKVDPKKFIGGALGIGMAVLLASQILVPFMKTLEPRAPDSYGAPQSVGRTLMSLYVYPFEIASLLLLVGIVGSIILAKRRI